MICLIAIALAAASTCGGEPVTWEASPNSPTETVETLWLMATAGELLTPVGWQDASGLFTQPLQPPKPGIIVFSNFWGPAWPPEKIAGQDNVVIVGCWHWGTIDSALRFTPAPKTDAVKEGEGYHLVFARTPVRTLVNGRLVQSDKTVPQMRWQIDHPIETRFTTVNTAIRYILEERDKSTDLSIKQNADKTLATLLGLK